MSVLIVGKGNNSYIVSKHELFAAIRRPKIQCGHGQTFTVVRVRVNISEHDFDMHIYFSYGNLAFYIK